MIWQSVFPRFDREESMDQPVGSEAEGLQDSSPSIAILIRKHTFADLFSLRKTSGDFWKPYRFDLCLAMQNDYALHQRDSRTTQHRFVH
jgi:hypothetical protein